MYDPNLDGLGTTPLGLFLLACMIVLTLSLPRRHAAIPLLLTTCYIPLGQFFAIAGVNFQFFRVILFVAWCRAIARSEFRNFSFTKIDRVFIAWLVVTLVIGSFTQPSNFFDRLVSRCGEVYNAAGAYFLIRFWVRNVSELISLLRFLSWAILPLAFAMTYERITGYNIFSIFGGVSEITGMRDGGYRAQGAFRHAILAGTYGATLYALFVGLFFQGRGNKWRALVGIFGAGVITMTAASSGAALALLGSTAGLMLWRLRLSMRMVRWAIVGIFAVLAMSMNAPVWYVFARVSEIAGGTGWYRSYLIEQTVNHFDEWFLTGSLYTAHWAPGGEIPIGNPDNTDIINQFVLEGLQGGILKVGLFTAIIVLGFKNVGRFTRIPVELPFSYRFMIWALGVCLFAHSISFLSVTYFDQIVIMWFWLLAILAMLENEYKAVIFESENSL